MKYIVLFLALCLMASLATGHWSEPVTVAESVSAHPWTGPVLVPTQADSVWTVWVRGRDWYSSVQARCWIQDTWRQVEQVTPETETSIGYWWLAGIVDDSGRILVAYYKGDYLTRATISQDSAAIYTSVRTSTGWGVPMFVHPMMMEVFPYDIVLGRGRDGAIGMAWAENFCVVNAMCSVMVSLKTPTGWTERRCLAPGHYPDVGCDHPALTAGDNTRFWLAFSRWTSGTWSVEAWTLEDSLVSGPTTFSGASPWLAGTPQRKFLVFIQEDRLMGSTNDGSGWTEPVAIANGLDEGREVSLCVDALDCAWVCWDTDSNSVVLASYNRGLGWSEPETVATGTLLSNPKIASDQAGRMHCVWTERAEGSSFKLKHAVRLSRPAVEEGQQPTANSQGLTVTIVRGILRVDSRQNAGTVPSGARELPDEIATSTSQARNDKRGAELLDAVGRKVMSLHPGANDVSRLAPGVYFVHQASNVQKVVIQR